MEFCNDKRNGMSINNMLKWLNWLKMNIKNSYSKLINSDEWILKWKYNLSFGINQAVFINHEFACPRIGRRQSRHGNALYDAASANEIVTASY